MTAGLLISEIYKFVCVADMFFKMVANYNGRRDSPTYLETYGRCNSPTYLKMFSVDSLTPKTYTLTLDSWL